VLLVPETSGLVDGLRQAQAAVHAQLSAAVKAVQGDPVAGFWLIAVGFGYGVLHAAGPGHGKVVIATYLGTGKASLKRGIVLSCIAAVLQAFSAIALVLVATSILELGFRDTRDSAWIFEVASYGMVIVLGLWLAGRATGSLFASLRHKPMTTSHHHHHDHSHHTPSHDVGGEGESCAVCGHAHGPSRSDLDGTGGWAGMIGIVTSIGLRPCTGAILVLLIAEALDLRWAGIVGALSMSVGTALTVSSLAALTVYARGIAIGLMDRVSAHHAGFARHLSVLSRIPMLVGGIVIAALGSGLMWSVFSTPSHPLF
jgi:ABC-type nickel/cobalt efflux system permease component RcnA